MITRNIGRPCLDDPKPNRPHDIFMGAEISLLAKEHARLEPSIPQRQTGKEVTRARVGANPGDGPISEICRRLTPRIRSYENRTPKTVLMFPYA
jgi:FAD/FMN-containing dehydrogenase